MTTIEFAGTLLAAGDDRTLTYRLLPFGEAGRTSMGKVTVSAGSVSIPADVSALSANLEHDRTRPVAKFVSVTEADDGLHATLRVLETTAGNDLLVEAREGVRTGISVEVDNPVIRAGAMSAGALSGAGFVTSPAFPSAQLVAADTGELEDDEQDEETPEGAPPAETEEDDEEEEAIVADDQTTDAVAARTVTAAAAPQGMPTGTMTGAKIKSADDLFSRLAAAYSSGDQRRMLAALDETVQADWINSSQPAWLGEVWSQRAHRQKYKPLFTQRGLTAMKMTGWKWADRTAEPGVPATPTAGTYAGFPAQPTSTEVKAGPVDITASRIAGANAFDRATVDFTNPEFWAGYYREAARDLSVKIDAFAETHLFTAANYTALNDPDTLTTEDEKTALSLILTGYLAIEDIATPDYAVVGADLFRKLALTERQAAVEYLSVSLGLDPMEGRLDSFRIIPSSNAAVLGKVLVGSSSAHEFFGEKSVRVDTVNIGTGGVETGLFSYQAAHTGSALAHVLVTPTGV